MSGGASGVPGGADSAGRHRQRRAAPGQCLTGSGSAGGTRGARRHQRCLAVFDGVGSARRCLVSHGRPAPLRTSFRRSAGPRGMAPVGRDLGAPRRASRRHLACLRRAERLRRLLGWVRRHPAFRAGRWYLGFSRRAGAVGPGLRAGPCPRLLAVVRGSPGLSRRTAATRVLASAHQYRTFVCSEPPATRRARAGRERPTGRHPGSLSGGGGVDGSADPSTRTPRSANGRARGPTGPRTRTLGAG